MTTDFLSPNPWPALTKAVRSCRQPCAVAVAYLGAGASRLLPLPKGSRLVVDASDHAVASGQTCPADLLKLLHRGVRIFSQPNLHAKVVVVGRAAWVGSANASNHSASQLIEAIMRTTDAATVRAARQFVRQLCLNEMTPTELRRLARLYRPPIIHGERHAASASKSRRQELPCLHLAQLHNMELTDREQALHDAGWAVAKRRRKRPRAFVMDSFLLTAKCAFRPGETVIQVTDEGGRDRLMSPPGKVLYVRTRRESRRWVSFVYLERPDRPRRPVRSVARKLRRGSLKLLHQDGLVRDAAFAISLLQFWGNYSTLNP